MRYSHRWVGSWGGYVLRYIIVEGLWQDVACQRGCSANGHVAWPPLLRSTTVSYAQLIQLFEHVRPVDGESNYSGGFNFLLDGEKKKEEGKTEGISSTSRPKCGR